MAKRFSWKNSSIHQKAYHITQICSRAIHSEKRQKLPCLDCKLWIEPNQYYRSDSGKERLMHETCIDTRLKESKEMNLKSDYDRKRLGFPKPPIKERKQTKANIVKTDPSPKQKGSKSPAIPEYMRLIIELKDELSSTKAELEYFKGYQKGFVDGLALRSKPEKVSEGSLNMSPDIAYSD
jgi:hypothetical protein